VAPAALTKGAQLHFDPATATVKPGETTTIGLAVQDAQDLYSIPLLIQFDPKVISVDDVRQGGFLSGGTQPIAIVQRVDKERGQAIISATRMPNTPGVSGSGTVFGIVVRGVAAGSSTISIIQVNARDSQQRPMQMVSTEATVKVQP
jgi:general secretion pathway protein D